MPPHAPAATTGWQSTFLPLAPGPGRQPLRIAVRWTGPPSAPAALCVHGLTRHGHDFDALAEAFAGPLRILTPDLPGRGDSDWCEQAEDYGDRLYLDVLEAVLRHFDTGPVHWIGTSLGAALALRMTQRRPQWLRSLVMNDCGAWVDGTPLADLRVAARERPGFADLASARPYLRARYAEFGIPTEEDWAALERHALQREADGLWRLRFDPRVVGGGPVPAAVDMGPLWQAVPCPVLILRGAQSRLLSRATCDRMVRGHPQARWIEVPGAGHAPHLAGEARLAPIRTFLEQAGAAG